MIATRQKPKRSARAAHAAARALPDHFTKTAILAAATKVFARQGIAAARVEDILIAAKIARRTFYKYFASKDEVLAAIHEIFTGELLRSVEAAQAERPADPLAGIRAGIDTFLGFYAAGPRGLREIVEIAMRSDSVLAPRRHWFRAQVVRILDDAIFALDGRRIDPFVYYALLSALEGLSLELGAKDSSADEVERARQVIQNLVENALGLAPPSRHRRA